MAALFIVDLSRDNNIIIWYNHQANVCFDLMFDEVQESYKKNQVILW